MRKYSSLIGFILIGVILFGYTFYQNKLYEKQKAAIARADSIKRSEAIAAFGGDTVAYYQSLAIAAQAAENGKTTSPSATASLPKNTQSTVYKDETLNSHHAVEGEETLCTIQNDLLEIVLSSNGAQPYAVTIKNFTAYDSTALNLIRPGMSEFNIHAYVGENIQTKNFNFQVAEANDSTVVFRLPFDGGGYIEQKYSLSKGTYSMANSLSFIGLGDRIPKNVSALDIDWSVVIPRLEKGYKNEKQYSKLDYLIAGDKRPTEISRGRDESKSVPASISWFAFQQQFFSAFLYSENNFSNGSFSNKFFSEDNRDRNLMTSSAALRHAFNDRPGQDQTLNFEYYFGPNHFKTLKAYDREMERIIPLGGKLVSWISRLIIIPSFNFLSGFIANWGIIILLMTIFIKLVVSPLTIKSYKSSAVMNLLKPEIDKINEKYPKQEDAMKKQQATMDLYKRAGINPMGGCLPMLLQFPVLFAMFRFFPGSIELRGQRFLWAEDLSSYDSILDFGFNIPLYGDHISLFALLMAITMFVYSKMSMQGQSNDPSTKAMQVMSVYFMPIMMLFICNNLSSGLTYYYFLSNLFTMLQTWIIKRFFVNKDKILAKLNAPAPKKSQEKSKWQKRLEEAQKMQREMAKNGRK